MNKQSFSIEQRSHDYQIDIDQIGTHYDGYRSFLHVPVLFEFHPKANKVYELILFKVNLKLTSGRIHLSEVIIPHGCYVTATNGVSSLLCKFLLDNIALNAIENHRQQDVQFLIEFEMSFAENGHIESHIPMVGGSSQIKRDAIIQGFGKVQFETQFTIVQSIWTKMLNSLGHKNLKLVEIPISSNMLGEEFDEIISEFNSAEKYFNQQDYNKCVAHCRTTLDGINRNLKKIRDKESSESTFRWLERVDEATYTWIDTLCKNTSNVASKVHHSNKGFEFSKVQAESIYTVTVGLLNYVSHLAN